MIDYILNTLKQFINISPFLHLYTEQKYSLMITDILDITINNIYDIEMEEIYNYFIVYFQFTYIKNVYNQYQNVGNILYLDKQINLENLISNVSIKTIIYQPKLQIYIRNKNIINDITQKNILIDIEYGNIKTPLEHTFMNTLVQMQQNIDKIYNNFQNIIQIHPDNIKETIIEYVKTLM